MFDAERYFYFKGAYSFTFSGNARATPRYDYNQVMSKLDLDDRRLAHGMQAQHQGQVIRLKTSMQRATR
jgi:hypothetical protein